MLSFSCLDWNEDFRIHLLGPACPCSAWLSQSSTTACPQCHQMCFISCCQLGALCECTAGSPGSDFPSCMGCLKQEKRTRRGEGLKTNSKDLTCYNNFFFTFFFFPTSSSLLGCFTLSFSWLHGCRVCSCVVLWLNSDWFINISADFSVDCTFSPFFVHSLYLWYVFFLERLFT